MDIVSENIANVNTTHGLDGKPYQRQEVIFESMLAAHQNGDASGMSPSTVQVARVAKDQRAPIMIYNPTHPDADSKGMVAMPDINIHEEMVDMISASRAYEANLAVVKNSRSMAMETLSILKH
jgi:flagellar basal-body rod protein FlgC